jgi:Phage tail tube protein, GTA-gp10
MSITAEAPRGGVVEYIGGTSYTFILRNREIERFEDKHRGIFDLWDGFFGKGKKPSSREVRDILALGLVGGGKKDHEADKIILTSGPEDLLRLYGIAQAVLGVAFMPDAMTEGEVKKKNSEDQPQSVLTSGE